MYNPEVKEGFLETYIAGGKERLGCRSMFEIFSPYEESIGKDIAEMSVEEVICATRLTTTGTYKTAAAVQSRIKAYVRWCDQSNSIPGVNRDILKLDIEDVDASDYFSKTLFRDEEELIREIQSVRRFDDGFTEGIVLVFGWLGIEQKDVLTVKIKDVDMQSREIYLEKYNKTIGFSEVIADVFRTYERTKEGSRSAGGSSRPVFRDDSYDTYIRKYCPKNRLGESPLTISKIKNSVGIINQLYMAQEKESRLWGGNVVASGALYRVRQLEISGVNVFSLKSKEKVISAFGLNSEFHEVMWMYKNYKKAFNL